MTTVTIKTKSDADFKRTFLYQTIGAVPISLVGKSMRMVVRSSPADANLRLEASTTTESITILGDNGGNTGKFTINIKQADLVKLQPGDYVHSLIASDASTGEVTKIWDGTLRHDHGPSR